MKLISCALALLPALAAAQDIAWQERAGIRWACGGVGVEERAQLAALRPQASLELLFVTARRGGYLADVDVAMYEGNRLVLRLNAPGPMCLVSAPAAKYRVEATYNGVKRAAEANSGRVVLAFPEEPWDGIRVSDEERAQGRGQ